MKTFLNMKYILYNNHWSHCICFRVLVQEILTVQSSLDPLQPGPQGNIYPQLDPECNRGTGCCWITARSTQSGPAHHFRSHPVVWGANEHSLYCGQKKHMGVDVWEVQIGDAAKSVLGVHVWVCADLRWLKKNRINTSIWEMISKCSVIFICFELILLSITIKNPSDRHSDGNRMGRRGRNE